MVSSLLLIFLIVCFIFRFSDWFFVKVSISFVKYLFCSLTYFLSVLNCLLVFSHTSLSIFRTAIWNLCHLYQWSPTGGLQGLKGWRPLLYIMYFHVFQFAFWGFLFYFWTYSLPWLFIVFAGLFFLGIYVLLAFSQEVYYFLVGGAESQIFTSVKSYSWPPQLLYNPAAWGCGGFLFLFFASW